MPLSRPLGVTLSALALAGSLVFQTATPVPASVPADPVATVARVARVSRSTGRPPFDAPLASQPAAPTPAAPPVTVKTVTVERSVPFTTRTVDDASLEQGTSKVTQAGRDGTEQVAYRVAVAADGVEVARTQVWTQVVAEPVEQVVANGTQPKPEVRTEPAVPSASPDEARAIGAASVAGRGWGEDQFACLDALWSRESGWRADASNGASGAYGIPQALPGSKMASAGDDWRTSAATQIAWGLSYVANRYGTPCGAWEHFEAKHWY